MSSARFKHLLSKQSIIIALAVVVLISSAFLLKKETGGNLFATKILFVGDMMFDRTIRSIAEKKGYEHIFSCLSDYVTGFDAVVGNLEGPITPYASKSSGTIPGEEGNTTFTFDQAVAGVLARFNFTLVHLGNNHIRDFGREGVSTTKAFLEAESIGYFGAPNEEISIVKKIGGTKIAFVSFNQFLGQNDPQKTIDAIWKAKREADVTVVYTHWGDEYVEPTEYMKSLAHRFIDAGADMVVGSHPHVIQSHEVYEGKHIYYSLGNFIFDQYWTSEVKIGQGLEVTFKGNDISIAERYFDIGRDGRTCVLVSK